MEDVQLADSSTAWEAFSLVGPSSASVLPEADAVLAKSGERVRHGVIELEAYQVRVVSNASGRLRVWCHSKQAAAVWDTLRE